MITFIEFGSGIGGMRLSMQKNGNKCIGYSDIESYNQAMYKYLHESDNLWFHDNINTLKPENVPEADCYCISCPNIGDNLLSIIESKKPKFIIGEGDYLIPHRKERLRNLGYYVETEQGFKKYNWEYNVCQRDTKFNILPMQISDYVSDEDDWKQKEFPDEMLIKLKKFLERDGNESYEGVMLNRLTQIKAFAEIAKKINENLEALL